MRRKLTEQDRINDAMEAWDNQIRRAAKVKEKKEMSPWVKCARDVNSAARRRGRNNKVTPVGLKISWEKASGSCSYCGVKLSLVLNSRLKAHWDHIVPLSRGGLNEDLNLTPACRECNTQKGTLKGSEFRLAIAGVFVPLFGMLRASHVCST